MKLLNLMLPLMFAGLAIGQGFTIQVEPTQRIFTITPEGKLTHDTQYGLAVKFCSDDAQVVSFAAEVSFRAEGSQIFDHVNISAWPNFNKCGIAFVWVGKVAESKAVGWEVTGIGRRADSN